MRSRVEGLLLGPLASKMDGRVGFSYRAKQDQPPNTAALDSLLEFWDKEVLVALAAAQSEDEKLLKKIRKTEKEERAKGIVALGNQDTKAVAALKRSRPGIWEALQQVLEKVLVPVRKLRAFFVEEMGADKLDRMVAAVPVIATRALCDWYFQKSLADYEQLEQWWATTKASLQSREELWQLLLEKEGYLLRRVETGIEDVGARRHKFSVFANFGGTEAEVVNLLALDLGGDGSTLPPKFEQPVSLLANTVGEMHRRLRQIRDCALWRIVESAQTLHKQLSSEVSDAQGECPWQAIRAAEGVDAMLRTLRLEAEPAEPAEGEAEDPLSLEDAFVLVYGRCESLLAVITDVRDSLQQERAETGAPEATLAAAMRQVTDLAEELLGLLDEPSADGAKAWLQLWEQLFTAGLGEQLERAMAETALRRDHELMADMRRARRRWLVLARGLQVFFSDLELGQQVVQPMRQLVLPGECTVDRSPSAAFTRTAATGIPTESTADESWLSLPPSPRLATNLASGYSYRPPERRAFRRSAGSEASGSTAASPENARGTAAKIPALSLPGAALIGGDSPMGSSPTAKFVQGEFVSLRPTTPTMRLPPLTFAR